MRRLDPIEADILAGARFERPGADEDSAIALRADLELEGQLVILERPFKDEHVIAGVRVEGPVLDMALGERFPLRAHPPRRRAAVEEELPAGRRLRRGELIVGGHGLTGAGSAEESPEEDEAEDEVFHRFHPRDHPGR
jgi:hypothetical protein